VVAIEGGSVALMAGRVATIGSMLLIPVIIKMTSEKNQRYIAKSGKDD